MHEACRAVGQIGLYQMAQVAYIGAAGVYLCRGAKL